MTAYAKVATWVLIACVIAIVINTCQAEAQPRQPQCGPRAKLIEFLGRKYQESKIGQGLIGEVAIGELYVSPKGSWTFVLSNPQGISCIRASGHDWQEVTPEPIKPGISH